MKQQFIDLAKECKTGQQFYEKAQQWQQVPTKTADWFYETYNHEMSTPEQACQYFVDDVHNGEYDE